MLASRRWSWSGCTRTSARRSSTPPASRSPRTGCVGLAAADPRRARRATIEELNLGGGLGIAYVAGDDPRRPKQTLAQAARHRRPASARRPGCAVPRLSVEPGRAHRRAGHDHRLRGRHGQGRHLDGGVERRYVCVDGGMSDNIRTALYDADYTCVLANRASDAAPQLSRVVGKHCESGDIVVRDSWLPGDVAPGDLLAVAATGAYCRSMASNYNHVPRPAGGRGARRRRRRVSCAGRPRTTCCAWTSDEPVTDVSRRAAGSRCWAAASVGSQVVRLLREQADDLAARVGAPLELAGIAVRRPPRTPDVPGRAAHHRRRGAGRARRRRRRRRGHRRHRAGPRRCCSTRCARGKSVVTANKALLAEDGADAARRRRRRRRRPLLRGGGGRRDPAAAPAARVAGRRPHHPRASASSTAPRTSSCPGWTPPAPASTRRWTRPPRSGYAEADPTADVDGFDAAAKAAILAGLAFHTRVTAADVYREGISEVTAADIASARGDGLHGQAAGDLRARRRRRRRRAVAVRVHPAMIPRTPPAGRRRRRVQRGVRRGRGRRVADVLRPRRRRRADRQRRARRPGRGGPQPAQRQPRRRRESPTPSCRSGRWARSLTRYHVALDVADQPGVLAAVAGAFAEHGVSASRPCGRRAAGDAATLVVSPTPRRDARSPRRSTQLREHATFVAARGQRDAGRGHAASDVEATDRDASRRAVARADRGLPRPAAGHRRAPRSSPCSRAARRCVPGAGAVRAHRLRGLPQGRGRQPDRVVQGPRHDRWRSPRRPRRARRRSSARPPATPRLSAAAYAVRAGMTCAVLVPAGQDRARQAGPGAGARRQAAAGRRQLRRLPRARPQAGRRLPGRAGQLGQPVPDRRARRPRRSRSATCSGDAPDVHCIPVGNAGNITAYWMGYQEYAARRRRSTRTPADVRLPGRRRRADRERRAGAAARRRSPPRSASATRRPGRWPSRPATSPAA